MEEIKLTEEQLKEVAREVAIRCSINEKEVLTSHECAIYLGVSKSCLYKWTMGRIIPHYKSPTGKLCFFNRKEIEKWCLSNKVEVENI